MATMTLLGRVVAGAWQFEDSGGVVAHTESGTTYDTSAHFAGEQGVIVNGTDVLEISLTGAELAAYVPPTTGSMAIRYRHDTGGGILVHASVLEATAGDMVWLASSGSLGNRIALRHAKNNTSITNLDSGVLPATGAATFAYGGWNGTAHTVNVDGTRVSGTRSTPQGAYGSPAGQSIGVGMYGLNNTLQSGCMIEAVAFFDGELTTAEQDFLAAQTDLWTFGMALEPPTNAAPVVSAGADATITAGATFTRDATFTDSDGVSTSWTATVDYGEGAGLQAVTPGAGTVPLSNVYEAVGVYTVTVRVTDDGGLSHSDSFTLTVNAGPTIGSFVVADVTGTDAAAPTITLS